MPVYMTYRPKPSALGTKTRLTCFALIGCTLFNWVSCIADRRRQLSCVGEGVYSNATQLNSTRRRVELPRYTRALSCERQENIVEELGPLTVSIRIN